MDRSSASDTTNKIRLTFRANEEAITYAERHSLEYTAQIPREVKPKLKAYAVKFLVRAARRSLEIKSL